MVPGDDDDGDGVGAADFGFGFAAAGRLVKSITCDDDAAALVGNFCPAVEVPGDDGEPPNLAAFAA